MSGTGLDIILLQHDDLAGDANNPRAPDHTSVLRSMSVYQIFRNFQCLNDLRARIYDLGTLITWLSNLNGIRNVRCVRVIALLGKDSS